MGAREAIVKFTGEEPVTEEREGRGTRFSFEDGSEYVVYDDFDKARDDAIEQSEELIEDMGIEGISWENMDYPLSHYVQGDWLYDDMHESNLSYARDIATEESDEGRSSRLEDELVENGLEFTGDIDVDAETYATDYLDYDDPVEWIKDNFGDEELNRIAKENPDFIDIHAIAEDVVDHDGNANTLASYDLKENVVDDCYIYRID